MNQNSDIKKTIVRLCVLVLLAITALNIHTILLHGAKKVTLPDATPLTGPVSQSFTSGGLSKLPVYGTDYTLTNTKYFENNNWVVTEIKPKSTAVGDSWIILQKKDGVYTTALGPGTAFSSTYTNNLPSDVGLYLISIGATYDPVN